MITQGSITVSCVLSIKSCLPSNNGVFVPGTLAIIVLYKVLSSPPPQFIGRVGVVATVQYYGDMVVRYSNNKVFQLNPEALTKVR